MSAAPLLPGATIGVLGGGQLGRMLALEARRMGYRTLVLDPTPGAPAAQVADAHLQAPLDDLEAALELARHSDVVTLEWENAALETLREMEGIAPLRPGPHVLEVAQHRIREKEEARRLGLPTAEYRRVTTLDDLHGALRELGTPAVLKTTRGGYDGLGQAVIRVPGEAEDAYTAVGPPGTELILESFVDFRAEASVICARSPRGEIASFPVVENVHVSGILDTTIAPAPLREPVVREIRRVGEALAEGLDVVGLLAVEVFVGYDGEVWVNEIAPRPHNSGHYTWEACAVSQFEQQLRAVCGLPLGSTELLRPAAMVNLLGRHIGADERMEGAPGALSGPGVALHLYGKSDARPGRKMGHLTALGKSPADALGKARAARAALLPAAR